MTDVVELLADLIRFDTTNPPGNESACIAYVQRLVEEAGVETRIVAKDDARPNLIARVPGAGEAPPLLLYGHVDVVTTAGQKWSHPPFAGELVDDWVWGRGALDMKGGVAMLVDAFLRAARGELKPRGDVILAVLSDEENGGDFGARFLAEEHADLFEGVKHALGEFGGARIRIAGRSFYPIQVAEKQICWLTGVVRGPGGHAALGVRGSAMGKVGRILARLDSGRLPVHVTAVARAQIEGMADALPRPQSLVLRSLLDPRLAEITLRAPLPELRPLDRTLRNTVSATIVHGGEKINVVPSRVELELDARSLPGYGPEDVIREIRSLVGPELELDRQASRSLPGALGSLAAAGAVGGAARARPERDPGADAPGRRDRRPLLRGDRDPDIRLPAAEPPRRLRLPQGHPRRRRARAGGVDPLRRRGGGPGPRAVRRMKLLVLGGTKFLGRGVVEAAGSHEVTIANRGRTNPELFPGVERIQVDLMEDLGALSGREWDAVVDLDPTQLPRHTRRRAELLCDAVGHYVFTSTISVYADPSVPLDESSPVLEPPDPEPDAFDAELYGNLKVGSERAVQDVFGERCAIVRPGLIVGPHDPTDRFTYWPRRLAEVGPVLAPGRPEQPVQIVDARDLGAFLVRVAETRVSGVFNGTGPAETLTLGDTLERIAPGAELVWVDDETLLAAGVGAWMELPLWLPGEEYAGMLAADISRALAAGLTFRPLEETARDTLAWSPRRASSADAHARARARALAGGVVG